MIKKIINQIFHGKIQTLKFSDIQNDENKVYNITFQENEKINVKLYTLRNVRIVQSGNTCFSVLKDNFLIEELCFQSKNLIKKRFKQ